MVSTEIKTDESSASAIVPLLTESVPSDDYYATNVRTLFSFVEDSYRDLLNDEELRFSTAVLNLSNDALRLYARILSRRGPIFLEAQFVYREVKDATVALHELEKKELVKLNSVVPSESLSNKLTIGQLKEIFDLKHCKGSKSDLVSTIHETHGKEDIVDRIRQVVEWFELDQTDRIASFSLLFFGDRYQDLSTFVVHDLGILRLEDYTLDAESRQFKTREEIDCYLSWWELSERLSEGDPLELEQLVQSIELLQSPQTNRTLERQRSKLLNRIGRELERREELSFALQAYEHSTVHPARERQLRVFQRLGQLNDMERLRTTILDNPLTIEEKLFAEKFKRKLKSHVYYNTKEQVLTETITEGIETVACREFEARGWKVWHLENHLPLALFGLAYWDWIYAPVAEAFVNPFQVGPRDLYTPEFFATRREVCDDPLIGALPLTKRIVRTFEQKIGIANPIVNWKIVDESLLQTVIRCLGEDSIRKLLQLMQPDLRQMRSGFPDLFVVKPDDDYQFVEVKGPTDQVRPNQHIWLQALASINLPAHVLKYKEMA